MTYCSDGDDLRQTDPAVPGVGVLFGVHNDLHPNNGQLDVLLDEFSGSAS